VYLAPGRPARITDLAVATKHQGRVEREPYAAAIRSVERQAHLEHLPAAGSTPAEIVARYHWPGRTWAQSLDAVSEDGIEVQLGAP
jgi:hypothetical protein